MNEPLLSIIVPIYNVEDYLEQCIDSIVRQTYNNLEIILVDDGSTDSSGLLCDNYQKKDSRIQVIHKRNEGVSVARNVGLQYATGELLGFVDSDDYLESSMYSELWTNMIHANSDLACCAYKRIAKNEIYDFSTGEIKELSGLEMLEGMVIGLKGCIISPSVGNRLYKKNIFGNLLFPEARIFEDKFVSTEVLLRANKVIYLNKALYNYRVRDGSLTQRDMSDSDINDFVFMMNYQNVIVKKYLTIKTFKKAIFIYYCILLGLFSKVRTKNTRGDSRVLLKKELIKCKKIVRNSIKMIDNIPKRDKYYLYISTYSIMLYFRIMKRKERLLLL